MVQHRFLQRITQGCKRIHLNGSAIRFQTSATCRFTTTISSGRQCIAKAAHDFSPAELAAEVPVPGQNAKTEELDEKERLRRERISLANSGKVAWNKGRKHSPETIAKIRERTKQAMLRDEVVEKVKEGRARQLSQPVNPGIKERIRSTLLAYHAAKRLGKTSVSEGGEDGPLEADAVVTAADSETVAAKPKRRRSSTSRKLSPLANIQEEEAMAHSADAETGDPMEGGKQTPQPPSLPARRKARVAAIAAPNANADHDVTTATAPPPVLPKPKRKPAAAIDSDTAAAAPSVTGAIGEGANEVSAPGRGPGPPHGVKRSPEHRAAIAAAIRRKWQDPAYRASAIAGIRRAAGSDAGVAVGEAARRRQAGNRAKLPGTGPGAGSSAASVGVGSRTEAGSRGATARKNNLDEEELPLTVRSSRAGRGGTRRGGTYHLEDGAVHSANSSSSSITNDSRSGAAVGGDPHSGDSSDTATPASSGGRAAGGGSSHGVNPATRLAHVQRLVRQVLVAERLVANTENLLRQFTQRRHALRNDPVIRSQADEQLRSVTATLQLAKVKLELLRAKVPPDARYNEKGDVWFAPHVAGSPSGPQVFRPLRAAASAGSGSGDTAGSMPGGTEEISDNRVPEDGVAGQRSSNSSTSSGGGVMAVSGSSWHGGISWQENGRGKGLDESGTVVDVDGSVADTGAGAGQSGDMGAPEFGGSNPNNGVGLGGNGAHSHRWQNDYQHHAYSSNRESSSPGNGNNGTNGLKGPVNSYGLNGNALPLDPYKELKYTDLDEEGEDEDEGEDDEDGFWWSSGGGHSPPSGRSPTGPGGLGTFADLPAFDPDEKIQVDLTSLDPLNTLLLRPINGHATPHPGVTKRRSSSKSNSSTRAGLELEPPSDGSADSRVNDDAVGGDGTGDAAAATADPMHGADSNEKSSRRGGSLNAGLGSNWLAAHGDGGGGAAHSDLQLPGQLRSENARDLAAWPGGSQGRTLGELQALLPESHAWLKGLLTHHEVVITSSLQAAGHADAAKQEFDWLIRLQEHVAAGSRVGHGLLSPATNNSARVFGRRWSEAATSLGQEPGLQGVVCPMAGPKPNAESVGGNVDGAWLAGGKELGAGRQVAAEQRLQLQEEEVKEWDQRQQQHAGEQSTDRFVDAEGDVQASVSVARERRSRRAMRLRKT